MLAIDIGNEPNTYTQLVHIAIYTTNAICTVYTGLLFADDTSLVASDKEGLKRAWMFWLSGVRSGG